MPQKTVIGDHLVPTVSSSSGPGLDMPLLSHHMSQGERKRNILNATQLGKQRLLSCGDAECHCDSSSNDTSNKGNHLYVVDSSNSEDLDRADIIVRHSRADNKFHTAVCEDNKKTVKPIVDTRIIIICSSDIKGIAGTPPSSTLTSMSEAAAVAPAADIALNTSRVGLLVSDRGVWEAIGNAGMGVAVGMGESPSELHEYPILANKLFSHFDRGGMDVDVGNRGTQDDAGSAGGTDVADGYGRSQDALGRTKISIKSNKSDLTTGDWSGSPAETNEKTRPLFPLISFVQ